MPGFLHCPRLCFLKFRNQFKMSLSKTSWYAFVLSDLLGSHWDIQHFLRITFIRMVLTCTERPGPSDFFITSFIQYSVTLQRQLCWPPWSTLPQILYWPSSPSFADIAWSSGLISQASPGLLASSHRHRLAFWPHLTDIAWPSGLTSQITPGLLASSHRQRLAFWPHLTDNAWPSGLISQTTPGLLASSHRQRLAFWPHLTDNAWPSGLISQTTPGLQASSHRHRLAIWPHLTDNDWHLLH
jgi:hypothetical protein